MGLFDGRGTVDAFKDLLDKEKVLILRGDIDGVVRLAKEKERLLAKLGKLRIKRSMLTNLRHRAERNNRLLRASARGFRAVQDQLRRLTDAPATLKTYGQDGQTAQLGKTARDFNKRA